jgi:hypothetical protein
MRASKSSLKIAKKYAILGIHTLKLAADPQRPPLRRTNLPSGSQDERGICNLSPYTLPIILPLYSERGSDIKERS